MKELPIIPIDDAFIGVCLRKLGLRPTNHKGFKSWGIKYLEQNNCVWNEVMTFHKLQPEELEQMWKAFVKRGKKTRITSFLGFWLYNTDIMYLKIGLLRVES